MPGSLAERFEDVPVVRFELGAVAPDQARPVVVRRERTTAWLYGGCVRSSAIFRKSRKVSCST